MHLKPQRVGQGNGLWKVSFEVESMPGLLAVLLSQFTNRRLMWCLSRFNDAIWQFPFFPPIVEDK
jgi:hypothetical protein